MPNSNVELICSIAELAACFERSDSIGAFLDQVVRTVAEHMQASVCSVYLYRERDDCLVLQATYGLDREAVGQVTLRSGEGIVGRSLKELRPISVPRGDRSPFFKLIPGIREEGYGAFVAVPILRGLTRVGVLVIQHTREGFFDDNDVTALRAITSQLAGTIENAKLLMSLRESPAAAEERRPCAGRPAAGILRGTPSAPGIARGRVARLAVDVETVLRKAAGSVAGEHGPDDFDAALDATVRQLESLQEGLEREQEDVGAALIFSAHLLILKDAAFTGKMRQAVSAGVPPARAVADTVNEYVRLFAASPLPHFREKVQDVRDLGHRLLSNLYRDAAGSADYSGQIVVAADVLPSDMVKLKAQRVEGLVVTGSSVTAHVAILARSLDIPVVGCAGASVDALPVDEDILIDGNQGHVFIRPSEDILNRYRGLTDREAAGKADSGEARTQDGDRVAIFANINLLSELKPAVAAGAEGVGLYRSEFPFIIRNDFPGEEEQCRIYAVILREMGDRPVVFRTLDIGGDKMVSYFSAPREDNPFMGLRAIRFSLRHRGIFADQLRALLRAGADRDLQIMFPLVGSLDDFLEAQEAVAQAVAALQAAGVPHNGAPRLGAMIEVPSAVEVIEELAEACEFLSIGSNDLVQYMLAADRTNREVADYYVPHHPAVLRSLKRIVAAANAAGKPVSLCGEMGADPVMLPFLLGIGLRCISVDTRLIPVVRDRIRSLSAAACGEMAETALKLKTVKETARLLGVSPREPAEAAG